MYSSTQSDGTYQGPVFRAWISPIIAIIFGYFSLQFIYDVFFHPLAKCPGPFFAKFSKLPNFYHALKGDRHIWIWQNHQIYGDKVRVHPNEVLFLAPQAHKDIYGAKANVGRAKSYRAWQTSTEANTALTTDPPTHARKRKILNQAFTEKSVKHAADFVVEHTERWIELLADTTDAPGKDGWTSSRNMSDWNDWLVFDILGDLCFGRSFDVKEPKPNPIRKIPHLIIQHVQLFYPILQSPFVDFFIWAKPRGLDYLLNMMAPQEIRSYYAFINNSVTSRMQMEQENKNEDTARKDMFHFLCKATDPVTGEHYSEDALQGEAAMLIVAGSDSTSSVLAGLWFYLSRNEAVYKRLGNEIRSTFRNSDEIVSGPKLASCVYLHACIDEALRIAPAGPSEFAREILPGGAVIDGEFFPAGVVVGCAHWAMGHNEHVFGDPGRFRPERYIPSDITGVTAEDVSAIRSYYHPFLIGPFNCVGKNIAMTEMALVVARTLFQLDLRAVVGEDLGAGSERLGWGRRDKKQYQISDAYITVHEGPILQFRKRVS
ncbi:hypothetical protein DPSP01_002041 [Paraphaeosphaeria sporulosa]|uniref:Cytochrome P450 n=1 Tax=Paraphaeosphaeria sporulosa TaxID=1460663 RepID=A0A177D016_9PLEO|nr:cytochrome P450 [Paraphaeosphaeria sporulosa]OAG12502.1 cytochrome P450 [Paraphaeosphaeria sporulosa]